MNLRERTHAERGGERGFGVGIDLRERRHATARIDSEQRGSTRGSRSSDRASVPIQHGCAARGFLVKTFVMMRTILEQFHHIKTPPRVVSEASSSRPRRRPRSWSRPRVGGPACSPARLAIARPSLGRRARDRAAGCPPLRPARRSGAPPRRRRRRARRSAPRARVSSPRPSRTGHISTIPPRGPRARRSARPAAAATSATSASAARCSTSSRAPGRCSRGGASRGSSASGRAATGRSARRPRSSPSPRTPPWATP